MTRLTLVAAPAVHDNGLHDWTFLYHAFAGPELLPGEFGSLLRTSGNGWRLTVKKGYRTIGSEPGEPGLQELLRELIIGSTAALLVAQDDVPAIKEAAENAGYEVDVREVAVELATAFNKAPATAGP